MKLEEIDAIEFQSIETAFAALAEMRGSGVRFPLVGPRPLKSCFRCDDQILRIRV